MAILIILAALALAGGALLLSQATMGVGIIGGACLLAIMARIVQANAHQRALLAALGASPPAIPSAAPAASASQSYAPSSAMAARLAAHEATRPV